MRSTRSGLTLGVLFCALGVVLLGWSGWIYHLASVADTTDESARFWIGMGSLVLAVGCVSIYCGARTLRRGGRSD